MNDDNVTDHKFRNTSSQVKSMHRRNNRRDQGRLVPQHLGWGTNNVLVL